MPLFLRNGSFLFVLQSQPFYQAQLVHVTTISTLRSYLARVEEAEVIYQMQLVPMTIISIWDAIARLEGEAVCLSRAVHRKSLKRGLVYEEWIHFLQKKRLYTWMNENEEIYQVGTRSLLDIMSAALNIIAKLSTMTQDAIVYKVSSCFFFKVIFFVFDCSSARTRANPFYNFM